MLRNKEQKIAHFENLVNTALKGYIETQGTTKSCIHGYAILRYAANGYLKASPAINANDFVKQYPISSGYTILRMAKKGLLEFDPSAIQ